MDITTLPAHVPGAPAMTLRLVLPTGYVPAPGHVLSVITTDGFAPLRSRVDTDSRTQGFPLLYLPGALTVLGPSAYFGTGSIWVAYPSANAVISGRADSNRPPRQLPRHGVHQ